MNQVIIAEAENWLKRSSTLLGAQRASLAAVTPALMGILSESRARVIGLGGSPGTGKSTLAHLLRVVLAHQGVKATVVSLDDYYLTRGERARLAADVHPWFATRGVPGTHDLGMLLSDLEGLLSGDTRNLVLPKFDKASDDRMPKRKPWQGPAPDIIMLEGWCIGCPPLSLRDSATAINSAERRRDPTGIWRDAVRVNLERYAKKLHPLLDLRWFMAAPDWDKVVLWRWQQEQGLGERKRLGSRDEVRDFLAAYERLCRHMTATCEDWADSVIRLDRNHCTKLLHPGLNK